MIRKYNESDLDAIIRIWLEASIIAHNFIPQAYWERKVCEMRDIYIPSSNTYVYVDDSKNEVIGFISLVDNYIAALFVSPEHQGKSIGSQLMNHVKQLHETLTLGVYTENLNSVAFYKKHEFVIDYEKIEENTGKSEYVMIYTTNKMLNG
ncbi:MAG: N-acetyltransferase [Macellibacteroides fermentans]|uniref:N-acetyltransferase n=1 Tax=Macellibacteroides fermentans TaxID=879969 RepID=UPI003AC7DFB2